MLLLIDCSALRRLSQGLDEIRKDFLLFASSLARVFAINQVRKPVVKRHLHSIVSTAQTLRSCALDGAARRPMFERGERDDEDQTQPGEGSA